MNTTGDSGPTAKTTTERAGRRVAFVSGAAVIIIGIVVLAAWYLHRATRGAVFSRLMDMKANTAASFVLSGTSIALLASRALLASGGLLASRVLLASRRDGAIWRALSTACAGAVLGLGLATSIEYLSGHNLGIDQLLVTDAGTGIHPGRMAPNTALSFVLLGTALFLCCRERALLVAQVATLAAALVALFAITGYGYSLTSFYGVASYTPMALHSAVAFLLVSIGILALRPTGGLLAVLAGTRAGGILARRMLPVAVGGPLVLGYLCLLSYRIGLFSAESSLALLAVSSVVVVALFVWRNAVALNVLHDERVRAGESLRRHEEVREAAELAQLIVETAQDAFVSIDADGRVIGWNPQAERMFGWSRQEILGRLLTETIIPGRHRDGHANGLRNYLATGAGPAMGKPQEVTALRSNGAELPIELTISPLRVGGTLVFNAFLRDITERKRADTELSLIRSELEQKSRMLQSILNGMGEGVVVASQQGKFLVFNHAAERILGQGAVDVPPDHWSTTYGIFQKDGQTPFAPEQLPLVRAIHGEESDDVELLVRNAKVSAGALMSVSGRPLRDAHGELWGGLIVLRDITARRRAEECRVRVMAALNELGELLQACHSPDDAYALLGQKMRELFPGESGAVFMLAPSRQMMESKVHWGNDAIVPEGDFLLVQQCWALRRGQPHYVPDTLAGLTCKHVPIDIAASTLCLPLSAGADALGVLVLATEASTGDHPRGLTDDQRALASTVARQTSLALSNLKLRETLHSQSIRDPLTGLFNRRYMEESLSREIFRCERSNEPIGIMMIDVDHFKQFNDSYGHEAGDAVLRSLGELLKGKIRGADIPCRYGGEELVVILPGASLDDTNKRASVFVDATRSMRVAHRGDILTAITISVGVSCYPKHSSSVEDLLFTADKALYQAKSEGRDRVVTAERSAVFASVPQ